MNRFFKVVFNLHRGQYVVCGDHSKNHTKSAPFKTLVFLFVTGLATGFGGFASAKEYSIYEGSEKSADVTLVRKDPSSTLDFTVNAYNTDEYKVKGTTADKLYATNVSDSSKIQDIPMVKGKWSSYYPNDIVLYYNQSEAGVTVNHDLNAIVSGVSAKILSVVHVKKQNVALIPSSTVKNVSLDVKDSTLNEIKVVALENKDSSLTVNGDILATVNNTHFTSNNFIGGYIYQYVTY